MSDIIRPEFRDQFAATLYPFGDNASLATASGLKLPRDVFLDASLFPVGNTGAVLLRSIEITETTAVLTVGTARAALALGAFSLVAPDETVYLSDAFNRPAGILVLDRDRAVELGGWDDGIHSFDAAEFAASCVIPAPEPGLRSLSIPAADPFTGEVWIVGGDGVVLSDDDGEIRVDIVGDPLFKRRVCDPVELFTTPRFLKTLSGQTPNRFGNMQLEVGSRLHDAPVLRIFPDEQGSGLIITTTGRTV